MEAPDPARSEQCDLHRSSSFALRAPPPSRRNAAARTRRPIAALSDGGPQRAVLLDHQPAVVVAVGRGGEDAVEVEHARPELGEEARPDRGIEATDRPAAQTVEDMRVDVLEVDVGHPIAEFAQRRDRVAAADRVVADVEADADQLGIEAGGQSLDLGRRLDERPAVGMEGRPMAGRDGLCREPVDHLEERVPAGVGQHRGAGLARAAGAFLATGRQVEGDDQDLAAAVVEQAEPLAADGRSRRGSVRRPSPGSTGRPRPVAGCRSASASRSASPSGKPMPSWVPSYPVRAISSRIVGASVPCRRSARSTLFHRIGTVPIDAPRQGVAGSPQGGAEVGPRAARLARGRSSMLLLGHAGRPSRALLGMVLRARGVPPAGLVGAGRRRGLDRRSRGPATDRRTPARDGPPARPRPGR